MTYQSLIHKMLITVLKKVITPFELSGFAELQGRDNLLKYLDYRHNFKNIQVKKQFVKCACLYVITLILIPATHFPPRRNPFWIKIKYKYMYHICIRKFNSCHAKQSIVSDYIVALKKNKCPFLLGLHICCATTHLMFNAAINFLNRICALDHSNIQLQTHHIRDKGILFLCNELLIFQCNKS